MRRYLEIFAAVLLLIAAAIIFGNDDNQCPPRLAQIDSLMNLKSATPPHEVLQA